MNAGIRTEAAQLLFWEFINPNFFAVCGLRIFFSLILRRVFLASSSRFAARVTSGESGRIFLRAAARCTSSSGLPTPRVPNKFWAKNYTPRNIIARESSRNVNKETGSQESALLLKILPLSRIVNDLGIFIRCWLSQKFREGNLVSTLPAPINCARKFAKYSIKGQAHRNLQFLCENPLHVKNSKWFTNFHKVFTFVKISRR